MGQAPPHGHKFDLFPKDKIGLDAYQFIDGGKDVRRYSVSGYVSIGYKRSDLLVLGINQQPDCAHRGEQMPQNIPILDLAPPRVGRIVHGYGYPDNPNHVDTIPNGGLGDYSLYSNSGAVEAINFKEGTASLTSYRVSMKTVSGMSGGPVFTERDGKPVLCGIFSSGGPDSDHCSVSPIWQLAWAATDAIAGMPQRRSMTVIADLMDKNIIPTIGSEHLSIIDKPGEDIRIVFDRGTL